jgi:hypothetical protein
MKCYRVALLERPDTALLNAAMAGFIYQYMLKFYFVINLPSRGIMMLKRTVVIFAAAAFFGGALPTQTAQAGDDIWDLMNPSWWADEVFDNNDDDWRYYRRHHYNPYWGGHYGVNRPQYVIVLQSETKEKYPEIDLPE